jgi:hypothetical protein
VTVSRFDLGRRARRTTLALLLLAACRPGLPPRTPEADPADPDAPAAVWTPPPDVLRTSAFDASAADAPDPHAGHDMNGRDAHQGHDMNGRDAHQGHEGHEGHGGEP